MTGEKIPVWVGDNERYPDYHVQRGGPDDKFPSLLSLTEEELADYERVVKEYNSWQSKLGRMAYPDDY